MTSSNRLSFLISGVLLAAALVVGAPRDRVDRTQNVDRALASASAFFDSTVVLARTAQPTGPAGDELTIAFGYLERARLGLGDPLRLADEATHDPRLGDAMGDRVARALLVRVQRGDVYVVDPVVLDGAGPWSANGHGATGQAHLALIARAIRSTADPRVGELAVRLAYMIESAKGTLAWPTVLVATQAAALLRDRALAAIDVQELLAASAAGRTDPIDLISDRRSGYRLHVEAPPLTPLAPAQQLEAMTLAPALIRQLDTLDRVELARSDSGAAASIIGRRFATRLATLAARRPPVPQVLVTLRGLSGAPLHAANEEAFAAAAAAAGGDRPDRPCALTTLSVAVALRSLAQSQPWFPGDGGPDAGDLTAEFGLGAVSFSPGVPVLWQPFYLRELQLALRDIQTVLPAYSARGLRVQFNTDAPRASALAMHDPRTRTLQLSLGTSGGTIAHELSHDLDWQVAQRHSTGGYSTDRAMADRTGTLSRSVHGLAEARLLRPVGPSSPVSVGRPTELFARADDWFIASTLAQSNRSNGFLSAIEDGLLPGYAAGPPTSVGTAGSAALAAAIREMTYVPDSIRAAFEAQWSDPRAIDPALLVRRVLDTPVSWRAIWNRAATPARQLLPAGPCRQSGTALDVARERILFIAADARARGLAVRRARMRGPDPYPNWVNSLAHTIPWATEPGERVIDGLRAAIVADVTGALADQGVVPVAPPSFFSSVASCATISR